MKVLIIDKNKSEWLPAGPLQEYGVYSHRLEPSFMSAFTAMKVAKDAERYAIDLVAAHSQADAMAAVSARKLTSHRFKIAMLVEANSEVPRGIASDLRQGVDGWIFQSQRLLDAHPQDLKNTTVIPPLPLLDLIDTLPEPKGDALLWAGPIDGNAQRLKDAVEGVAEAQGSLRLIVCGTGKAREVMPVVKRSRDINASLPTLDGDAIVWLGDGYDLAAQTAAACAVVQSGPDIAPIEQALACKGYRVVQPQTLATDCAEHQPTSDPDTLMRQLTNYFTELIERD